MAMFGNYQQFIPQLQGMLGGMGGNPMYQSPAFNPPTLAPQQQMMQQPFMQQQSFLPEIQDYRSAISSVPYYSPSAGGKKASKYKKVQPLGNQLQYNPIVQLPELIKPDPFGFFSPRPAAAPIQQPVAQQPVTPEIQKYIQDELIKRSRGSTHHVPLHRRGTPGGGGGGN